MDAGIFFKIFHFFYLISTPVEKLASLLKDSGTPLPPEQIKELFEKEREREERLSKLCLDAFVKNPAIDISKARKSVGLPPTGLF